MSNFSKLFEESQHNLVRLLPFLTPSCSFIPFSFSLSILLLTSLFQQYDLLNKLATPLSEFHSSRGEAIEKVKKRLAETTKENDQQKATRITTTATGLYESSLNEGRRLVIAGICGCFDAYHEFFSRGLQAINSILSDISTFKAVVEVANPSLFLFLLLFLFFFALVVHSL
jgi:hypothetical protein